MRSLTVWVNNVYNLCRTCSKTRAQESTDRRTVLSLPYLTRVKALVIPTSVPTFPPRNSTLKITRLPLINTPLSTLSTTPIIKTMN